MKIEQEKTEYKPITITFENAKEAALFLSIIDRIDNFPLPADERKMAIEISNIFSNGNFNF
jgi:hypothetical protein